MYLGKRANVRFWPILLKK